MQNQSKTSVALTNKYSYSLAVISCSHYRREWLTEITHSPIGTNPIFSGDLKVSCNSVAEQWKISLLQG